MRKCVYFDPNKSRHLSTLFQGGGGYFKYVVPREITPVNIKFYVTK